MALSHRNLPISQYLRDRLTLLASAGRALQLVPATPYNSVNNSLSNSANPSSSGGSTPDAPDDSATDFTPPSFHNAPEQTPAAIFPQRVPLPVPPASVPESFTFLSSARVDAIIEQALPRLPPVQQGTQLPAGINVSYDLLEGSVSNIQMWLEITVARSRLLPDLIERLDAILDSDPHTLFLPLKYVCSLYFGKRFACCNPPHILTSFIIL